MKKMIVKKIMMFAALLFIASPAWAMEAGEHKQEASKVHLHGYGELHYNGQNAAPDKLDMHRMVWGLSYQMSDNVSLHTEVDFEHAAQEMELEFSYLDFNFSPTLNLRAGLMLMPVGPLNETHEPPLFYSVERPRTHNVVIPTTWQEGGLGLFGGTEAGLKYKFYFISGLNAEGFSANKGIRGGRSKVSGNSATDGIDKMPLTGGDFGLVTRVEYAGIPGFNAGFSGYQAGAGQGNPANAGVDVTILEGDLRYRIKGLEVTAVYAQVDIGNAGNIKAKKVKNVADLTTGEVKEKTSMENVTGVGEKITGWYGEVAYDIHPLFFGMLQKRTMLFVRMEEVNTQAAVPTGVTADPKNELTVNTYGLAFYPIADVAFKVDWETVENGTGSDTEWVNAAVAYMF